ncbi:hypothetical protein [Desulfobacter vibrioformis]|uniref:hypothetical protein n=1 Tax=Desulfobacter vibrioformis TaxID=34031 RepID=UPI00054F47E3|nr:hypothetical protein [Desulfobacter vibrioformis]
MNNFDKHYFAENGPVYCYEDLKKARQKLKEREDKLKKEREEEKTVTINNKNDLLFSLARQSCMQTDHYLFMSSMRDIADIEKDLVMGKCNALMERILELESQISTQVQPKKRITPIYLTNNVIQFPGERRVAQ